MGDAPDNSLNEWQISPNPDDVRLSEVVEGMDHRGEVMTTSVVSERPLTLFLNGQEIVTMMTIGDYPNLLAVGYLRNQNMLLDDDVVTDVDFEEDIDAVVVRTARATDYEEKLKKKVRTSGCAQGTVFGDVMESFSSAKLSAGFEVRTSWLYSLQKKINQRPSLYLKAGAIHGCALSEADRPLLYVEDVGRHNAVDKVAGYMFLENVSPHDKIFYTTGRLTSEMVIKTVTMGIPVLVSRSGFTAWGVELARQVGLTLVGRMRGQRFMVLSGAERLIYDLDPGKVADEADEHKRKALDD